MRIKLKLLSAMANYSAVLIVMLSLSACATLPPESVDLSKQIGAGISKARAAHLSTLDAFYQRLNKDNDEWVVSVFLPSLIGKTAAEFSKACKMKGDHSAACATLGNDDIRTIIADTIRYRDEVQLVLSKSRQDAARLIDDHYNDLLTANSSLTALLSSAVDVSKATKGSFTTANSVAGLDIDLDVIEKAFYAHLEKAGKAGAKLTELETNLSRALNKPDRK